MRSSARGVTAPGSASPDATPRSTPPRAGPLPNLDRRHDAHADHRRASRTAPASPASSRACPRGSSFERDALDRDLARRQLGHGRGGRMKIERDRVEVTGGVRHGRTLGGPIALTVTNRDFANWEERMNPWPVEAETAEVHLPAPRPRRPRRHAEVRAHRRPRHPGARQRAGDRGAGGRRRRRQGVPGRARASACSRT